MFSGVEKTRFCDRLGKLCCLPPTCGTGKKRYHAFYYQIKTKYIDVVCGENNPICCITKARPLDVFWNEKCLSGLLTSVVQQKRYFVCLPVRRQTNSFPNGSHDSAFLHHWSYRHRQSFSYYKGKKAHPKAWLWPWDKGVIFTPSTPIYFALGKAPPGLKRSRLWEK